MCQVNTTEQNRAKSPSRGKSYAGNDVSRVQPMAASGLRTHALVCPRVSSCILVCPRGGSCCCGTTLYRQCIGDHQNSMAYIIYYCLKTVIKMFYLFIGTALKKYRAVTCINIDIYI